MLLTYALLAHVGVNAVSQYHERADSPPVDKPKAQQVIQRIDAATTRESVGTLCSFGTRHTLSDTESSSRGIGAARRWLKGEFESYGGQLETAFDEYDVRPMPRLPEGGKLVNVMATLPGQMSEASKRVVYVVGHYDTINADRMDPKADAPGANDDASGTAVVLACARALANERLDATVVFLCTAGEEQGLVGATMHANSLRASGKYECVLVLNNDIVGDNSVAMKLPSESLGSGGASGLSNPMLVRVFSEAIPRTASAEEYAKIRQNAAEGDSVSRQLARYFVDVAAREHTRVAPVLMFRPDRFLRGGDQSAFNEAGFAGIRCSVPAEDYSRQHVNVTEQEGEAYGDVPSFVRHDYLSGVAQLNAAVIVHLANAPTPPSNARLVTAKLEQDTVVRWNKSPEPDVAGYEVVWRETTSPVWTNARFVGDVDECRLELSKDNFFIGVRAIDKDGYVSPVSFAWASAE